MSEPAFDPDTVDHVLESRLGTLAQLERNYLATGNPLYAWDAIRLCLNQRRMALPPWLLRFLLEAAKNLIALAEGHDPTTFPERQEGEVADAYMGRFLEWKGKEVPPDKAIGILARALGLSRRGYNAFASFQRDHAAQMAAIEAELAAKSRDYPHMIPRDPAEVTREVEKARNSSPESAKRTIRRGRRQRQPP